MVLLKLYYFTNRYNIRCNTVLPGFTTTPMTDMVPENIREYFKSVIPLKRFANSEGNHL